MEPGVGVVVTARDADVRQGYSGVHLWPVGMGTHGEEGKNKEHVNAKIIAECNGGSRLPL